MPRDKKSKKSKKGRTASKSHNNKNIINIKIGAGATSGPRYVPVGGGGSTVVTQPAGQGPSMGDVFRQAVDFMHMFREGQAPSYPVQTPPAHKVTSVEPTGRAGPLAG